MNDLNFMLNDMPKKEYAEYLSNDFKVDLIAYILNSLYKSGDMGLVSDEDKDENYHKLRVLYNKKFIELRYSNSKLMKNKEYKKYRSACRFQKVSLNKVQKKIFNDYVIENGMYKECENKKDNMLAILKDGYFDSNLMFNFNENDLDYNCKNNIFKNFIDELERQIKEHD